MSTTEFELASELLAAVVEAVDPAPASAIVAPGSQVAWDVCPEGMAYVRFVRLAAHNVVNCGIDYMQGTLAVGVLRCISTMQEDGSPPPDSELTAAAQQIMEDAAYSRQAILETLDTDHRAASLSWLPQGPQGNVAGGEWQFEVRYVP